MHNGLGLYLVMVVQASIVTNIWGWGELAFMQRTRTPAEKKRSVITTMLGILAYPPSGSPASGKLEVEKLLPEVLGPARIDDDRLPAILYVIENHIKYE